MIDHLRHWAFAVLILLGLTGPAQAVRVAEDFSSFWVMGASHTTTNATYLGAPYAPNRFADGPIWVDYFTDPFDVLGKSHGNLAQGGAGAITNSDAIPDLAAQALQYRMISAGRRGDRPLVALWFGGNDVSGASGSGTASDVATSAVRTIVDQAIGLLDTASDFLILNLHHVGETPLFRQPDRALAKLEADKAVGVFNAALALEVERLRAAGGFATILDVAALEDRLGDFGITNRTTACFDAGVLTCNPAQLSTSQYFDLFHPTSATHKVIGQAGLALYETAPSPVPLPATGQLLLIACGLVGWRFHRSRLSLSPLR